MAQTGARLTVQPEIISKLSSESGKLWSAAHGDGSENRINGDVILEAGSYAASFGILAAVLMWIRKKFRNRGKTKEDFAEEKEAAKINRTSAALEEMLREYLLAAQEGNTDQELLDELTDTLEEMHRCAQAGKLLVPGQRELSEIRRSIAEYTAAMTGNPSVQSFRSKESPEADEFRLIRELLVQQKEWLTEK